MNKNYANVTEAAHNTCVICKRDEFIHYFLEYGQNEDEAKVCNYSNLQFLKNVKLKDFPNDIQEEVIEIQNDSNFKNMFKSGVNIVV